MPFLVTNMDIYLGSQNFQLLLLGCFRLFQKTVIWGLSNMELLSNNSFSLVKYVVGVAWWLKIWTGNQKGCMFET